VTGQLSPSNACWGSVLALLARVWIPHRSCSYPYWTSTHTNTRKQWKRRSRQRWTGHWWTNLQSWTLKDWAMTDGTMKNGFCWLQVRAKVILPLLASLSAIFCTVVYQLTGFKLRQSTIHLHQLSHRDRVTCYVSWNLVNWCTTVRKILFERELVKYRSYSGSFYGQWCTTHDHRSIVQVVLQSIHCRGDHAHHATVENITVELMLTLPGFYNAMWDRLIGR